MKKLLYICSILACMNLARAEAANMVPASEYVDPSAFTLVSTFSTGNNPNFVAYSHNGRFAAVTNSADNTISVYAVDCGTGNLTEIAGSPFSTSGMFPSSIAYSPYDTFLAVTNAESAINPINYSNDSIAVYYVTPGTGDLTLIQAIPNSTDTEIVTPFSIAYSPGGQYAAVANYDAMGINDNIAVYSVSVITGLLTLIPSGPVFESGFGPLVVAYSPNGKFAAVTFHKKALVANFQVDPTSSPTPGEFTNETDVPTGGSPFGVAYSHSGKFAAVANSADNTVSTYTVDPASGVFSPTSTSPVPSGAYPTYVAFSIDDALLAVTNMQDGTVTVYCVDPTSGNITETQTFSNSPPVSVPTFHASGIQFAPCTDYAAVTSFGSLTGSVYDVNSGVCP